LPFARVISEFEPHGCGGVWGERRRKGEPGCGGGSQWVVEGSESAVAAREVGSAGALQRVAMREAGIKRVRYFCLSNLIYFCLFESR
jgi:hypothetical protein